MSIVNPLFEDFDQLGQLNQAGGLQHQRRFRTRGAKRGWGLIGPLAGEGENSFLLILERQHLATGHPADLENPEALAAERMKRMSYSSPSQKLGGAKCSLLGVSRRW